MLGRYLLPTGRVARLEFWRSAALVLLAVELGLPVSLFAFGLADGFAPTDPPFETIGSTFLVIAGLGTWSLIALSARRLHDRGQSGWWALLLLVPVAGLGWTLAWNGTRPGTLGPNRFGLDPRGGTITDAFDAETVPHPRRRPPFASTVLTWLMLAATTVAMTALLFLQSPNHPAHTASGPRISIGPGTSRC